MICKSCAEKFLQLITESIDGHESQAQQLLEGSRGQMRIPLANKIHAKRYKDRANELRAFLSQVQRRVDVDDA